MAQPSPPSAPTNAPPVPQGPPPQWTPQPSPPKKRKWLVPVLVVVIVGLVALVLLATVPVNQTAAESFSIANPGSSVNTYVFNLTSPYAGTFTFSWYSNDGGSVTFTVLDSVGSTLYTLDSSSGSGNVTMQGGGVYTFGIYDWLPETVQVSGTLHYTAPIL